jgi:hypothetical protein
MRKVTSGTNYKRCFQPCFKFLSSWLAIQDWHLFQTEMLIRLLMRA